MRKEDKSPVRGRKHVYNLYTFYILVRKISPLQGDGNYHILAFLYDLLLVKKIKFLTVGRNVILIYTSEIPRQGTMDAYGRFN